MDLSEAQVAPQAEVLRGDEMRTPDEVAAMLRLRRWGGGSSGSRGSLGAVT